MSFIRNYFRLALMSLAVILLGCDSDDQAPSEPQPVQLLKLTVDKGYVTKNVDNWVMVHDKHGVLLGIKKFESGQVLNFETQEAVPDGQMSVTLMSFDSTKFESSKFVPISFRSYSHLSTGQEWILPNNTPKPYTPPSEYFSVTIDGVYNPPLAYAMINTGAGTITPSYMLTGGAITFNGFVVERSSSTCLLTLELEAGHPQYLVIENVAKNKKFKFSLDDLQDFDHTYNVTFPAADKPFCSVVAYDAQKLPMQIYYSYGTANAKMTSYMLPYLNRFQKYQTNVDLSYNNIRYSYIRIGDIPKKISFPFEENYEIRSAEINNFSLAGNPAYAYFESYYATPQVAENSKVYVSWYIVSPTPGFKLEKFPSELTDVYKFLDTKAFEWGNTTFFSKGVSYDDWIAKAYKGKDEGEYEQYKVDVRK